MKKRNLTKIKIKKAQEKKFETSKGVSLKLRIQNLNSGVTEW